MSSSPTVGEGSALNSSRDPPDSSVSSHGSSRGDNGPIDGDTGGAGSPGVGSAPILYSVGATVPAASKFGAGTSVVGCYDELPQKVSELGINDVIERSQVSQTVGYVHSQSDDFDSLRSTPVQLTGRRNQSVNANYLLNFHFDPITRPQPRKQPPKKQQKVRPYSKDLFLQANYKFFVLDTGDYTGGSMDPDKMLEWEDVICVRYLTPFEVHCPICLETPLSPQITSCGHIFCFPCILRYLLMGGGDDHRHTDCWKRCPLCFAMISAKDLHTVYVHNVKPHNVGDHIHLTLLSRGRDSSVPFQKNHQRFDSAPCGVDDLWDSFTKFTLTSDVELSVREAKKELEEWLAKAERGPVDDAEKLPYVCAALDQLDRRMKSWADHRTFSSSPVTKKVNPVESDGDSQAGAEAPSSEHERDSYFFYQSVDGQHLILHPLNMKCLLQHYKSYDSLPERIDGRILELETVAQSEATRRRYRFLSHLPLTTNFQLCEIGLGGILPADALSPFMDEIKKREKQRKKLAKKEQEERALAVAAEWTPVRSDDLGRSSRGSAAFSLDDFEALGGAAAMAASPPAGGEKKSFSDVARLGFASGHDSPSLRLGESPPKPGSEASTAAGRSPESAGQRTAAMSFAGVAAAPKTAAAAAAASPALGRKGKKQAKVLLSTAGGRRY